MNLSAMAGQQIHCNMPKIPQLPPIKLISIPLLPVDEILNKHSGEAILLQHLCHPKTSHTS